MLWNIQAGQSEMPQPAAKRTLRNDGLDPLGFAWSPAGDMLAISNASTTLDAPNAVLIYKSDLSGLIQGFSPNTLISKQSTRGLSWAPNRTLIKLEAVNGNTYQTSLHMYDPRQLTQAFSATTINLGAEDFLSATISPACFSRWFDTGARGSTCLWRAWRACW